MKIQYTSYKTKKQDKKQDTTIQDKIYVYDVVNYKTKARGFWQDKNKLYRDNIKLLPFKNLNVAIKQGIKICIQKHQVCVFIKTKNRGIIIDKKGSIIQYFKCKKILNLSNKSQIKNAIKLYKSGITIYKKITGYYGEVFF